MMSLPFLRRRKCPFIKCQTISIFCKETNDHRFGLGCHLRVPEKLYAKNSAFISSTWFGFSRVTGHRQVWIWELQCQSATTTIRSASVVVSSGDVTTNKCQTVVFSIT